MNSADFLPFSLREIQVASNTLANMHKSGGDMQRATVWLTKIQPQQKEFWQIANKYVGQGLPLSDMLGKVFPADMMIAIRAGEATGTLATVFSEICATSEYAQETNKVFKKLIGPSFVLLFACVVSVLMTMYLLPLVEEMFPSEVVPSYIQVGYYLRDVFSSYGIFLAIGAVAAIVLGVKWATDPENKLELIDMAISLPFIGAGLLKMAFSKWARYMSIMHASGSSMAAWEMMRVCSGTLPPKLREPIINASTLLESGSNDLSEVFTGAEYIGEDANSILPHSIIDAFINGGLTGRFAEQLAIAAGILEKDGKAEFEAGIAKMYFIGVGIASFGVGVPALLYIFQMTSAVLNVTKAL